MITKNKNKTPTSNNTKQIKDNHDNQTIYTTPANKTEQKTHTNKQKTAHTKTQKETRTEHDNKKQ